MEARNRVEIGLSCRPARLRRLAESIPWNRFLGGIDFWVLLNCKTTISAEQQSLCLCTYLEDEDQRDEGKEYRFLGRHY
jgi:hypothetical protein